MAFSAARRSLTAGLSQCLTRRLHPSLSHLVPSYQDRHQGPSFPPPNPTQQHPPFPFSSVDLHRRPSVQYMTLPFSAHLAARRNFSSTPFPGPETDLLSDAATGEAHVAAGSFLPSVAAAAADWFPPVGALQHALGAVHSLTGLNWWTSIVLTTLLVRTSMIHVGNLFKSTMKYNSMDPQPHEEKMKLGELFKKCGRFVDPSIYMSFLFAIVNMAEKVPSLKEGGAYWFTDLTTHDELYILPVLATMTILATAETIMREGMVENRVPQTVKFSRVLIAMTLPFSSFPKAVYLFMITWDLICLGYFLALLKRIRQCTDLAHVASGSAHAPNYHLSGGRASMPAAARGSEHKQDGSVPRDQVVVVDVEKKRRTPRVITNRVRGDGP